MNSTFHVKKVSAEGRESSEQGTPESRRKAIEKYEEALQLWRAVGDRREEAYTLSGIGIVYEDLGEKQKALDYHNQALSLFRAVEDRSGEGALLSNIGMVYVFNDKQKAIDYFRQALPVLRSMNDREVEAATLTFIGGLYALSGEYQKALEHLEQALSLWRALRERYGELQTLSVLGGVYSAMGEKGKVLDYLRQADELRRAGAAPPRSAAQDRNRLAAERAFAEGMRLFEQRTAESLPRAVEKLEEVLKFWRVLRESMFEANTLFCIAAVYAEVGENEKALEYLGQALQC